MEFLKDRRIILAGAAVALLAGLGVAILLMLGGRGKPTEPPPASRAGLIVETGRADDTKLDPARPLRCFVGGRFVGETTLSECANRNGVATGALDVGMDETGALAAADQAGTVLTPLPPMVDAAPAPTTPAPGSAASPSATPASVPLAACWRYSGAEWRRMPGEITLNACAQALFGGRCEKAGGATYGRWGEETLRLVPGRVESSSDNRTFHTAIEQGANCSIPAG